MFKVEWDHDYRDGSFGSSEEFGDWMAAAEFVSAMIVGEPQGVTFNITEKG